MSLSFTEGIKELRSYIKLQIHQCQVCQNVPVPIPYGISISFDDCPQKNIEPITNDNEIFDTSKNIFIFNVDKNFFLQKNYFSEKAFIVNSYTTSIFILKKNFASVKIPIINTQNSYFYLKDINNIPCLKILISLEIYAPNIIQRKTTSDFIISKDILDINNKNSFKHSKTQMNTHLISSTNYNSSNGNSLLNLTNNICSNNIENCPSINFSPIHLMSKNNSYFIENKNKQMENNMKIINNNLYYKNNIKPKHNKIDNFEKSLKIKSDDDSIIINDNDLNSDESNKKVKYENPIKEREHDQKDNIENKINKLIFLENKKLENKISKNIYINEEYKKLKKDNKAKEQNIFKEKENYINKKKILEKAKDIYKIKKLDSKENLLNIEKDIYRQNIKKEIDNNEKNIFQNLILISNEYNNLEQALFNKLNINNNHNHILKENLIHLTPRKQTSFNKLNIHEQQKGNKNKYNILGLNKTIPHNPMYIKKLNFAKKSDGKIKNYIITTGRKLNNKKNAPINYKFKKSVRKLSSSISNASYSKNIIANETKTKILKTEANKDYTNSNSKKFKKIDIKGNKNNFYNEDKINNIKNNIKFHFKNLNKDIIIKKTNSIMVTNTNNSNKIINSSDNNVIKTKVIEKDYILNKPNNSYYHKK